MFRLFMGYQELVSTMLNQSTDKKKNQVWVTENKGLDEDSITFTTPLPGSREEEFPALGFSSEEHASNIPTFQQAAPKGLFLSPPNP